MSQHRGDIISPERRSALMARIRGRDTGPEMIVRRLLHGLGYRFRVHLANLPGRPDVVLPSKGAVIFVHGCFWHRHNCGLGYMPKTRREFWRNKFDDNVRRDRRVRRELRAAGWRVLVIWECQTEEPSALASRLTRFLTARLPAREARGQTRVRATISRPQHQRGRSS
jgi:DNA mismatch endonuclease, patch repair protein